VFPVTDLRVVLEKQFSAEFETVKQVQVHVFFYKHNVYKHTEPNLW